MRSFNNDHHYYDSVMPIWYASLPDRSSAAATHTHSHTHSLLSSSNSLILIYWSLGAGKSEDTEEEEAVAVAVAVPIDGWSIDGRARRERGCCPVHTSNRRVIIAG